MSGMGIQPIRMDRRPRRNAVGVAVACVLCCCVGCAAPAVGSAAVVSTAPGAAATVPPAAVDTAKPAPIVVATPAPPDCPAPVYTAAGYRNEVVVLMYHDFLQHPIPGDDITPADFAAQLALFVHDGYHFITLAQLASFVAGRGTVPPNALLLTFDNGYASQFRYAFPLLQHYAAPATFFPIASWLYGVGVPAGVSPLTLAEFQAMTATGLITVGTQGWDLHRAVQVGPGRTEAASVGFPWNPRTDVSESLAAYRQRVASDLALARTKLTPLTGAPLDAFAYPFGDYTPALISVLHQAGFRYLFAAKLGWANLACQSPDVLYRLNVGSEGMTPAGALNAVQTVARDAAADPAWRPPAQEVEVWR